MAKRLFESDDDYERRIRLEADEKETSSDQRLFESDNDYASRKDLEADESRSRSGSDQRLFEGDNDYRSRKDLEADETESHSGSDQRFFESDDDYSSRKELEANEAVIESETGSAPSQGFFESDSDYADRVEHEAEEHRSDNDDKGCFLTTACVERIGLKDDCVELSTLRSFRDEHLVKSPLGRAMVAEYYRDAPKIVAALETAHDAEKEYSQIYSTIQKVVAHIQSCAYDQALVDYGNMYRALHQRYLK